MTSLAKREHYLYRCYDTSGGLLYIGVTTNLHERFKKHRVVPACAADYPAAGLYARMAFWVAERGLDRKSAFAAEAVAIRNEDPELNSQHRRAA
jgi:predicted GIY-YIG superfamily endonuclease